MHRYSAAATRLRDDLGYGRMMVNAKITDPCDDNHSDDEEAFLPLYTYVRPSCSDASVLNGGPPLIAPVTNDGSLKQGALYVKVGNAFAFGGTRVTSGISSPTQLARSCATTLLGDDTLLDLWHCV